MINIDEIKCDLTPDVLLIDDQPIVAEQIREILSQEPDIAFHYCQEANQAFEMLKDLKVTTILLDLMMPNVDGLTMLRYLRNFDVTKDVPIIVLSSAEDPATKSKAFALGATDYLVKPPEKIELIARVKAHYKHYINRIERDIAIKQLKELLDELHASHLEVERANKELKRLAIIDPLTECVNRRYLNEVMTQEFENSNNSKQPLAVIMIDIDFFKQYNDTYGHQGGDDCLIAVAKSLRESINSETTTLARYGGEEFLALLPGFNIQQAEQVAEQLCQSVRDMALEHSKNPNQIVTISLGVSSFHPDEVKLSKVDELIKYADQALYEAKETGRNRVVSKSITA